MDKLQQLDPVAYVRFASVYREFKDVNTFMDEIKNCWKSSKRIKKDLRPSDLCVTMYLVRSSG